jgi:hypothetical protein
MINLRMYAEKIVCWLLRNRILSNEKTRSASAEFGAKAKAIRAASLQAPTLEAFPPTQNPFSEVAHIAVVNGRTISSSDVSGQVAL